MRWSALLLQKLAIIFDEVQSCGLTHHSAVLFSRGKLVKCKVGFLFGYVSVFDCTQKVLEEILCKICVTLVVTVFLSACPPSIDVVFRAP